MTPEELAAIRQRCEKATAGPWLIGGPYPGASVCVQVDSGSGWPHPEPPVWDCIATLDDRREGEPNPLAQSDADFIAHARTDIPALLDEIDGLKIAMDVYNRALRIMSRETLDQRGNPDTIMKNFIRDAREEIDREALCTCDIPPA
jgi:hypothetical protein